MLHLLDTAKHILIPIGSDIPLQCWGVTFAILIILLVTALVDIFKGIIPEWMIFLGLFIVAVTQGFGDSWEVAAHHLRQAIMAAILIWAVNFAWYYKFRNDALGMGDAKWTMLAVACFGIMPSLFAWGLGAVLALFFIITMWAINRHIKQVTFAPFLFAGLSLGLYWLHFF